MIQIKVFTSMSAHTYVNILFGGGGGGGGGGGKSLFLGNKGHSLTHHSTHTRQLKQIKISIKSHLILLGGCLGY